MPETSVCELATDPSCMNGGGRLDILKLADKEPGSESPSTWEMGIGRGEGMMFIGLEAGCSEPRRWANFFSSI